MTECLLNGDFKRLLLDKNHLASLTVPDTQEHVKGYTLYKIIIAIQPKDSLDEDPLKFVIWRRYSDIHKLHQKLALIHFKWRLKGNFPEFAKPKIFGRHKDILLLERRLKTEQFLQFVLNEPLLCNTEEFCSFLQQDQPKIDVETPSSPPTTPLTPARTVETKFFVDEMAELDKFLGLDMNNPEKTGTSPDIPDLSCFDPYKIHSQAGCSADDEDKREETFGVDSDVKDSNLWLLSTLNQLKVTDTYNFSVDSLAGPGGASESGLSASELDSRSISPCGSSEFGASPSLSNRIALMKSEIKHKEETIDENDVELDQQLLQPPSSLTVDDTSRSSTPMFVIEDCTLKNGCKTVGKIEDQKLSSFNYVKFERNFKGKDTEEDTVGFKSRIIGFFPRLSFSSKGKLDEKSDVTSKKADVVIKQVKSEANLQSLASISDKVSPRSSLRGQKSVGLSLSNTSLNLSRKSAGKGTSGGDKRLFQHDEDYLYQAAQFISSAQKSEAEGHYELAFNCYKAGVNLLLCGVQGEKDKDRRNAVRKKTAKYLLKAERIYHYYLEDDYTADQEKEIWNTDQIMSALQDPLCLELQGSLSELSGLKCIQVLHNNRLILVEEPHSHVKYVLKFISKSFYPQTAAKYDSIVPTGVPHMVNLVKFYETDNAIVLQLEYVPGGLLWTYLASYFAECRLAYENFIGYKVVSCSAGHLDSPVKNSKSAGGEKAAPRRRVIFSVSEANPPEFCGEIRLSCESNEIFADEELNNFKIEEKRKLKASEATVADGRSELSWDGGSIGERLSRYSRSPPSTPFIGENFKQEMKIENVIKQLNPLAQDFSIASAEEDIPAEIVENLPVHLEIQQEHQRCELNTQIQFKDVEKAAVEANMKEIPPTPVEETVKGGYYNRSDLVRMWYKSQLPGGNISSIPEEVIRCWAAQIVVALAHLHNEGLEFRDLRPDNILMRQNGSVCLTFCGRWSNTDRSVNVAALKGLYSAPEIGGVTKAVGASCDWFSLGSILFELVTGVPLAWCYPAGFTCDSVLTFPSYCQCSEELKDFITKLLVFKPSERLGRGRNGAEAIKRHLFFSHLDWREFEGS